ncbi:DUF3060 domain-containing protein [Embleya sp. NBC_00888]|uniref:DUF3060 domain-containing protein n=1 Tax=Embleya sp. NBC_00888 TaxID=2975960 RepID=UPI0038700A67|nr:DUF3060 domain-containing protein [Embleya sp. NBC_00888]
MRIRTVLPAILLTAAVAAGTTACEVGAEKKSDSAAPAAGSAPTAPGAATSGGGASAPGSASGQPSTGATGAPSTGAPKTGRTTSAPSTPGRGGSAPVVISGTGNQPTTDCTGKDVRIEGTEITVTLTGFCHDVTVAGGDHTIEVAWADKITVTGSNSLLFYGVKSDGGKPDIIDNGTSNKIMTR